MISKSFKNNGYVIIKKLIPQKNCDRISKLINKLKTVKKSDQFDMDFPFSKIKNFKKVIVPNKKDLNKLDGYIDYKKILNYAHKITSNKKKIFLKKIYTKSAFDGDNEFYHQDYAYRKNTGVKSNDYLQCFIALKDQKIENGCLRILKGSHKNGLIKHDLVMTRSGMTKLTISSTNLKRLSKKNKIHNLELSAGTGVFFSYLAIHGSSSNASEIDQPRLIIQMIPKNGSINRKKNLSLWKKRSDNEKSILKKMLEKKLGRYKKKIN